MATPRPMSEATLMVYCAMSVTREIWKTHATAESTESAPTETGKRAATTLRKTMSRTRSASGMLTSSATSRSLLSVCCPRSAR